MSTSHYVDTVPSVWTNAADNWIATVQRMFGDPPAYLPGPPADPTGLIAPLFDSARRVVDVVSAQQLLELNREYIRTVAGAAVSLQSAVRDYAEGVSDIVRNQVEGMATVAREHADGLTEVAREQAQAVAQAREAGLREVGEAARVTEREARRDARAAERAARAQAMERYVEFTKAELQDELARRDQPKTGNVDALRERLVDSDLASAAS